MLGLTKDSFLISNVFCENRFKIRIVLERIRANPYPLPKCMYPVLLILSALHCISFNSCNSSLI